VTRQAWRRVVVAVWLVGLSQVTEARLRVWQSDRALWADARAKAPAKPRAVMNYGRALELSGDSAGAEALYRTVIGLSFDQQRSAYVQRFSRAAAETNIAHLYMKRGWFATAMRMLDSTVAEWPSFAAAHYNRGSILWAIGACADAYQAFHTALQIDPTLPPPMGTCTPSESPS
jgi:tetratricopeptide (TPR) repeat protein